ncbi:MAG: hypothetical protein AAF555_02580 [Verrucomicrobiota bacterium]
MKTVLLSTLIGFSAILIANSAEVVSGDAGDGQQEVEVTYVVDGQTFTISGTTNADGTFTVALPDGATGISITAQPVGFTSPPTTLPTSAFVVTTVAASSGAATFLSLSGSGGGANFESQAVLNEIARQIASPEAP